MHSYCCDLLMLNTWIISIKALSTNVRFVNECCKAIDWLWFARCLINLKQHQSVWFWGGQYTSRYIECLLLTFVRPVSTKIEAIDYRHTFTSWWLEAVMWHVIFCGLSKICIVLPIANVWRNFSASFWAILWPDFNGNTINRKLLQRRFCKCDLPNPSHGSLRRYCW